MSTCSCILDLISVTEQLKCSEWRKKKSFSKESLWNKWGAVMLPVYWVVCPFSGSLILSRFYSLYTLWTKRTSLYQQLRTIGFSCVQNTFILLLHVLKTKVQFGAATICDAPGNLTSISVFFFSFPQTHTCCCRKNCSFFFFFQSQLGCSLQSTRKLFQTVVAFCAQVRDCEAPTCCLI